MVVRVSLPFFQTQKHNYPNARTTGKETKNFLLSALEHTRREFFFGETRAELCGFRNEGEIYETIPNALSGSRLCDMNEDDHEHEHIPHVAIARVLAALARSEGFASRYRVLKNIRFARTLCSPSPKRAIVTTLAQLLNSVREVKEWRDTGVCINMKHTKRRIKYLVAKSVALLSLGSASSGGENSWSSVISSLDDEDKNVMILRFLERGATRTCFRWRAMLRKELKSEDYGSSSTFSSSSTSSTSSSSSSSASSKRSCEDNDQDDFDEISRDENSGFCCGGSPSSTNDEDLSDEILLENSTSLKHCDSMCLVAMINLIASCTWCFRSYISRKRRIL